MYVRERNWNGDYGTGPKYLTFPSVSFHSLSKLFDFSRPQQGTRCCESFFVWNSRKWSKGGQVYATERIMSVRTDTKTLGVWCLKKNKSQMSVNHCSLAGAQASKVFQTKGVRHCLLLICSIFLSVYIKIFFSSVRSLNGIRKLLRTVDTHSGKRHVFLEYL